MPDVWVPFAAKRPLPEATSQPRRSDIARVLVIHVMVGTLKGTESYFKNSTSLESHFGLGCTQCGADLDGALWQWIPLDRTADANYHANPFAWSVETCDHYTGGTYTNPGFSVKQQATLIRLGKWFNAEWGVPLRQCPAWNASGFGWHAMWGAPSQWTNVAGKTCPNSTRVRQLKESVFPSIFRGGTPVEEDEMSAADVQAINSRIDELEVTMKKLVGAVPATGVQGSLSTLAHGDPGPDDQRNSLDSLADQLTELKTLLKPPA